ncbi:MAG: DUF402 domain-containing protein [Acidimicrobiia bacterium]|nr:DUF402 domain-containing protein [Acidimicrobiia bacterium]
MHSRWNHGEVLLRREVLGLDPIETRRFKASWHRKAWIEAPVYVVDDTDEQLVTYTAPGTRFTFPPGDWPTPDGLHPWYGRTSWEGHGCLMVQRPGEHHAVWHFWEGPDRDFACWYINLQTAFERTPSGYDTQDLEVDIVVLPDFTWWLKDMDLLGQRVNEGRYTPELGTWIREFASELVRELEVGHNWWDPAWAAWTPDAAWDEPQVPNL